MMQRVCFDTCVIINAFQGKDKELSDACLDMLSTSKLLLSDLHHLELLPKPQRNIAGTDPKLRNIAEHELKFIKEIFGQAELFELNLADAVKIGIRLAQEFNIKPLDALLLAAAKIGKADIFLTTESRRSPILRVPEDWLKVQTLAL